MNSSRLLVIETPNRENIKFMNMVSKYRLYETEFKKRYVKLITKKSKRINVMLVGFDRNIKYSSDDYDPYTILNLIDSMPMGYIRKN